MIVNVVATFIVACVVRRITIRSTKYEVKRGAQGNQPG